MAGWKHQSTFNFFCRYLLGGSHGYNSCSKIDTMIATYVPFLCLISVTILWLPWWHIAFNATARALHTTGTGSQNPDLKIYSTGVYWVKNYWRQSLREYWYLQSWCAATHLLISAVKFIIVFGQQAVLDATTPGGISFLCGWINNTTHAVEYRNIWWR